MNSRLSLLVVLIASVFGLAPLCAQAPSLSEDEEKELAELFKPVSGDNLPAAVTPSRQLKVKLLQIPNHGNWNNFSSRDLSGEPYVFCIGLLQGLEHRVFHSPHLYFDLGPEARRGQRVDARMRFAEVPARDKDAEKGKLYAGFELACRVCNADILLVTQWVAAKDGKPAQGSLWRYRRGVGVQSTAHFDIPALGTIVTDACASRIHALCEDACKGILPADEEAKFPAVPRMVANDKALRLLFELQDALGKGNKTALWNAYHALQKEDPNCTRAARDIMLMYRVEGTHESNVLTVKTGLEAIDKDPTDATLRAHLAHEAWLIMGQRHAPVTAWSKQLAEQALKVWPASAQSIIWYSNIAHGMYTDEQIAWLSSDGVKRCADGRVELWLGTACYTRRRFAEAIAWYQAARKAGPDEHEAAFALGMCCTHGAEDLVDRAPPGELGEKQRALAEEWYVIGSKALDDAISIDPSEMGWVYDFYVRCVTRKYHVLPTDAPTLRKLFLVQACRNRLASSERGDDVQQFNRLCGDVMDAQRVLTRMTVKEARETDADYELQLMARLQLAAVDGDKDDVIFCVRELRRIGNRGELFIGWMRAAQADIAALDKKEREEREAKEREKKEEGQPPK